MRTIEFDMAQGGDTSVDPRVAPQGTVGRVVNGRIDKEGRLVLRSGYTSLGTGVQNNAGAALIPRDLYTLDGSLVCAGNVSAANQTGIRALLKYIPSGNAPWRSEGDNFSAVDTTSRLCDVSPADNVQVLTSEQQAQTTNALIADAAVSTDGRFAAMVSSGTTESRFLIYNTETGLPCYSKVLTSESNARVLFCNTAFVFFTQTGTTINARTKVPTATGAESGATAVATATSAAPCHYDVAMFEGTTDFLIAFPTATGYTWRRFNSALAQQTTASVVSLANAGVAICGATAETVNVANIRAVSGVELRTFDPTTAALTVGPTNVDTGGLVYEWVAIARYSSTVVRIVYLSSVVVGLITTTMASTEATTAAHALTQNLSPRNVLQASKPVTADGRVLLWSTLGLQSSRPYGLHVLGFGNTASTGCLATVLFDGAARNAHTANTLFHKSGIARVGTTYYSALVSFDPRNKTYRSNLVSWELFSGERRQASECGGVLYVTGGMLQQYDGRVMTDVGFETTPAMTAGAQGGGGGLTLLGVYTVVAVFRTVAANGEVTQSTPSDPLTFTMTGVNTTITLTVTRPYSSRNGFVAAAAGVEVFADIYRTEAGGSIPRYSQSVAINLSTESFGGTQSFNETNSDAVVQAGALLYTQGAEGDVSGRLPIGSPGPCGSITETDGKILIGRLPVPIEMRMSTEKRPGESHSFVSDDIFFVSNQERVNAVQAADSGRRFVFGRSNIREILGSGLNAAGIGTISEPIEIEDRVGAVDWRSVCKTEMGVFFQASLSTTDPKIYLLPKGSSTAVYVSAGIRDVLELYPVISSATRHDEEQLVTFTLQNTAGTDGRIVHLDLRTSGLGKRGWVGKWIVDRVPTLEAPPPPELIHESIAQYPFAAAGAVTLTIPGGKVTNDRVVACIAVQNAANTISVPTGWTSVALQASAAGVVRVIERIYANTVTSQEISTTFTLGLPSVVHVKYWLLRGAHATQAAEAAIAATTGTTHALATLTPTWGAANNAWLTAAAWDTPVAPLFGDGGMLNPTRTSNSPTNFTSAINYRTSTEGSGVDGAAELASAHSFQSVAALGPGLSWLSNGATTAVVVMIAVRPLVLTGTPVRASVAYQNRLVVCSSTDVLLNTVGAVLDANSTGIALEWESADIYPMGPNGFGRHLSVVLLTEKIALTGIYLFLSYDSGRTWVAQRRFGTGLSVLGAGTGVTMRLQWVPLRRKIVGVRAKVVMSPDSGGNAGGALLRLSMVFDEMIGPSRLQMQERGSRQT